MLETVFETIKTFCSILIRLLQYVSQERTYDSYVRTRHNLIMLLSLKDLTVDKVAMHLFDPTIQPDLLTALTLSLFILLHLISSSVAIIHNYGH